MAEQFKQVSMKYVQACRREKASKRRELKLRTEGDKNYDRLANAWDEVHPLRNGTLAKRFNKQAKDWLHANQYTVPGVIRFAFGGVGQSVKHRMGLDGTTHMCGIMSVTASCGTILLNDRLSVEISKPRVRGFVLGRHHDATPIRLTFGALQELLLPYARFASKQSDGSWKMIPWSELRRSTNRAPKHGTVELFAMTLHAAWDDAAGHHHYHDIPTAPKIITVGNASTVYTAVVKNKSLPALSEASLAQVANENRFILIHEVPDNIQYNVRHLAFFATFLPYNIYAYLGGCMGHRFSRMGEVMFQQDRLTGEIYNCAFICDITQYSNTLLHTAWTMLEEELQIIDGPFMPPDQAMGEFRKDVVSRTFSRGQSFVRSRLGEDLGGKGEALQIESSHFDWNRHEP
jgi:hypothetical protein